MRLGVLPLFLRRSLDSEPSFLPPEIRTRWKDRLRELSATSLVLFSEHQRLMMAFLAAGVEVLPVKGPTLSEKIYGSPLLREFVDLDYIICPSQLGPACEALEQAGYEPEKYGPKTAAFRDAAAVMDHHTREIRYIREVSGIDSVVELHWNVFPEGDPHSRPRQWTSDTYALYLAMHGSRHLWQPLKHLCDFRDWIACQEPAFDWSAYRELARRQKLCKVAAAPQQLIRAVSGETVGDLDPALLRYVLAQALPEADLWSFHRLRMDLLDTPAQRWKYFLRLLKPGDGRSWMGRWRHLASRVVERLSL